MLFSRCMFTCLSRQAKAYNSFQSQHMVGKIFGVVTFFPIHQEIPMLCFDLWCAYIERLWNIDWCLRVQIQGPLLIMHVRFLSPLSDHTAQTIQSDDSTQGPSRPREIDPIFISPLTGYVVMDTLLNLSKLHLLICQVEITIVPIGFVKIKWIQCMKVLSTGCTDHSQYSIERVITIIIHYYFS